MSWKVLFMSIRYHSGASATSPSVFAKFWVARSLNRATCFFTRARCWLIRIWKRSRVICDTPPKNPITVPAGFTFGLPVGISFIGRAYSEPTLIKLAYAYEQASKLRRPPKFLPTADLRWS